MKKTVLLLTNLILLAALALTGCTLGGETPDNGSGLPSATVPEATSIPTETANPPVMMLLAGPESDAAVLAEAQAVMGQISAENGMLFEQRQSLSAQDAPINLMLVVALPPAAGLQELAAAIPTSRFLAVGVPEVSSSGNLVSVGSAELNTDFQAFMAGYISAVQADDWRVGLVYVGDAAGEQYRNAFLTGAVYYCGTCIPYFPPFNGYPLDVRVTPGAGLENFQSAVDTLVSQGVNTLHLAPGAQSEELYRYAANKNIRFVGTGAPPSGLEGYWIASVISTQQVDLRQAIGQVLNGQTAIAVEGGIEISYTGLSQARLNFFGEMLDQLESGTIDPQGGEIE